MVYYSTSMMIVQMLSLIVHILSGYYYCFAQFQSMLKHTYINRRILYIVTEIIVDNSENIGLLGKLHNIKVFDHNTPHKMQMLNLRLITTFLIWLSTNDKIIIYTTLLLMQMFPLDFR